MFNVVSYCKNLTELQKVFATANRALRTDGLFIFDCWNAQALKKDPPQSRFTTIKKKTTELYRLTTATPTTDKEAINLAIEIIAFEKGKFIGRETEHHNVRAWNLEDIKNLFTKTGFTLVLACQFGDARKPISDEKWAMTLVARKI